MRYFSGFCFDGESELFREWLKKSDLTVAGFSYGAIKAFKYASTCTHRIDKLQLFSPACFEDKSEKFKRLQSLFFAKNKEAYIKEFLEKTVYPSTLNIEKYKKNGTKQELKELLYYKWDKKELESLKNRGTEIEVYIGADDKIINSSWVLDFFKPYATVYYIKNAGHILASTPITVMLA